MCPIYARCFCPQQPHRIPIRWQPLHGGYRHKHGKINDKIHMPSHLRSQYGRKKNLNHHTIIDLREKVKKKVYSICWKRIEYEPFGKKTFACNALAWMLRHFILWIAYITMIHHTSCTFHCCYTFKPCFKRVGRIAAILIEIFAKEFLTVSDKNRNWNW